MKKFIEIEPFYPDFLKSDNYIIRKTIYKNINESSKAKFNQSLNFIKFPNQLSLNKKYITLFNTKSKKAMMSNHDSEIVTNQKFLDAAKGDVLIFGLGIGLIVFPLLEDELINSITIVEIDSGLINMVGPIIKEKDTHSKVKIINCDAFEFHTLIDKSYDTIYFDIWDIIDEKSFNEMDQLDKLYNNNLNTSGWIDSWCSEEKLFNKYNK